MSINEILSSMLTYFGKYLLESLVWRLNPTFGTTGVVISVALICLHNLYILVHAPVLLNELSHVAKLMLFMAHTNCMHLGICTHG